MALFVMIVRKMIQNKWLVFSLFLGMVISVALVSTMPIYSEAILSRMLVKDLETMQKEKNVYPATLYAKATFSNEAPEKRRQIVESLDAYMLGEGAQSSTLPVVESVVHRNTRSFDSVPEAGTESDKKKTRSFRISSMSDLEDHIKLTDGRMPAAEPVDGVYEVLVTEAGLNNLRAVLDSVFYSEGDKVSGELRFKPVGVFEKLRDDDPYFYDPSLTGLGNTLLIDEELFERDFVQGAKVLVTNSVWYTVLDYSKMELSQVDRFVAASKNMENQVKQRVGAFQTEFKAPALATIASYEERAAKLRTLMWSLYIPVLIMLGFYMFMVANLIASRQKNEIAVLRSRGAARWQIVASFAIEGILLSAAALAAGPAIGLFFTKLLGASNGFLSFVSRAALPAKLTREAYVYGAIAAAAAFILLLIPVLLATRVSIVGHKQQLARQTKTPLWHKLFLDVIFVAVAIYGLFNFRERLDNLQSLGLNSTDLNLDPLQFVVPALFIVGSGLLLLRLYPYLLSLIYWLGRRWWRPSMYATLIQVSRSSSQYQFLMVFLILTIATGIFSASAARTIDGNTEDRIRYGNGADIVLSSSWPNDAPPPATSMSGPSSGDTTTSSLGGSRKINYLEPAFEPYSTLPGVEHAAKVFKKKDAFFSMGDQSASVTLIGIDTDDFGMTTWFRSSLLGYPLNDYLNLIATDSKAVLISRTLAEQKGVKVGDTIWVGWSDVGSASFIVYGILDYFPTFNPLPPVGSVDVGDAKAKANAPMLIVGQLPRIQFQLSLEPYDVWLKMEPGYGVEELYAAIEERKLPITKVVNTTLDWNKAKNDPFLMAINGILTLGFLIAIVVSFSGFLLYWVLSLRGRTLQNGIMRAIGLSVRQMVGMLIVEQLLTSGIAVAIGVLVGNLSSLLYVPNFQIAFNPSTMVPPFEVIFEALDFARLYSVVAVMLLVGLVILGAMVSRTRIHQALKLGED
ncbi:ABC transporter permease [Cohnella fermenti]|uniref:FtsX-like permease family protein n=1 Tax=Cohnella fermenti TaxID=2565925 RepID=A0A4S4BK92_9BACL|nr:FtsX-like permease family protein [Cohnella fermenti]THF75134.1 FtsX-like permease family protein [Cohnella fermenti]